MHKITLAAAVTLLAAPLAAQTSPQVTNDLTVTMSSQQYRTCNDRPARPTWMDEVHPREAYKALAAMELYELRAWQAILDTDDCGCSVRFPSWEESDFEYRQAYTDASAVEHSIVRREWIELRRQLEPSVRELCEVQGNW
jgi:hypothetical protein